MSYRTNNNRHMYLLLCSVLFPVFLSARNAIVQKDRGERLGDRLLIICAVKYLALTHDLDFYYHPSQFIDQCALSTTEAQFKDSVKKHYSRVVTFNEALVKNAGDFTLFMAPWSAIDNLCRNFGKRHLQRAYFDQLQAMVMPITPLPRLEIPSDVISVAVHIRKGDGYDNPLSSAQIYKNISEIFWGDKKQPSSRETPADRVWPSKFPPEQYYIDQINVLADILSDKKIICYIFSDSKNTEALTRRIATYCNTNITFVNATSLANESPMVDLCKMAMCDCLIRAQSAYSIVAQIMGNHKIVFSPHQCEWHSNILYVPQVTLALFNSTQNNAMECILENCYQNALKQWINELFQ